MITAQIGNAVPVKLPKELINPLLATEAPSLSTFGGGISANPAASVPEYETAINDD